MDKIIIATHNGTFHVDEVMAYALLNYLFPDNELIRTRDSDKINSANIVIDVGQIYDPTQNRFDHHQQSFGESFDEKTTIILSSAGLIYKNFGNQVIDKFCQENNIEKNDKAYNDLYYRFFIEIDAHDNGIRQYSDNFYEQLNAGLIKQRFYTNSSFGQIISKLNTNDTANDEEQLVAFKKATDLAWTVFHINIVHYFKNQNNLTKEYKIIENAMSERFNYHSSGEIVVVKNDCNTWRKCIDMYEKDHPQETTVKFIIYESANKNWNVRTISDQLFQNRKNLLPLEHIKKEIKMPDDVIFVHNKLFIGASKTIETAIDMAIISLKDNICL